MFASLPGAQQQVDALTGDHRKALDQAVRDIRARGCAALDYRLSGSSVLEHICVRHLRDDWRVVIVFEADDDAWVVLVGQHDDRLPADEHIYEMLYALVGHRPEPRAGRKKPPCCDPDGSAPVTDEALVEDLAARVRRVATRRP